MKTILFMATSLNGKTTNGSDTSDTSWVTAKDVERMDKLMEECGAMLMGSNTYQKFGDELPIDRALQVVMTSNTKMLSQKIKNVKFTNKPPLDVLKELEQEGYSQVMIAGGSKINSSFIREDLIDEIRIIVKPLVIGTGKGLFSEFSSMKQFALYSFEKLEDGSVEVCYRRVK